MYFVFSGGVSWTQGGPCLGAALSTFPRPRVSGGVGGRGGLSRAIIALVLRPARDSFTPFALFALSIGPLFIDGGGARAAEVPAQVPPPNGVGRALKRALRQQTMKCRPGMLRGWIHFTSEAENTHFTCVVAAPPSCPLLLCSKHLLCNINELLKQCLLILCLIL